MPPGPAQGDAARGRLCEGAGAVQMEVDPLDPFSKPLRMPRAHVTVVTADLASAF